MDRAPWIDFGGTGADVHIAHANGFPPESYRAFATALATRFHVVGSGLRPLWPGADPAGLRDWRDLAADLRTLLRARLPGGLFGVGHSVGAVTTMLVSVDDPSLFRALVLIDPVLFCGFRAWSWGWMKRLGQGRRLPLVQGALRRREGFASHADARAAYAGRSIFARWQPDCLDDYIRSAFVPRPDGGVGLAYPRAWEARVFETTPHDAWGTVRRVRVPTLVLRGADTDTFLPQAAVKFLRACPSARVIDVPGVTHLLPMEQPAVVAGLVGDFLAAL